jgi:hypothetical protein
LENFVGFSKICKQTEDGETWLKNSGAERRPYEMWVALSRGAVSCDGSRGQLPEADGFCEVLEVKKGLWMI